MFRNYLVIAYRNILRGGVYSLINIVGLAIGLACFFLIMMYVKEERSYDQFHHKGSRIFRVTEILNMEGSGERSSSCPFPLGPALVTDYPNLVEQTVRFFNFQDPQHTIKAGEQKFNESRLFVADSNVFEVFDFKLLAGDPKKVLDAPYSMVISDELAKRYFGKENPIGKTVRFDGAVDMTITGVFEKVPEQSHIHFDMLISFSSLRTLYSPQFMDDWVWNPNWTYVLLKPNVHPEELEQLLPDFVNRHYPDHLKPQVQHFLQPLTSIHLHSDYSYEIEANNSSRNLYIFMVIGIFILLIACVNFMNLSTARSASRAKEVGIRKVLGADRSVLIIQFLCESVLLSMLSVLMSLVLAEWLLPLFNSIAGKQIRLSYFSNADVLLMLVGTGLVTGLFSGAYPALYLSSFQPATVLKSKLMAARANAMLRKVMVVFQFTVSVALIVSTGVVYRQLYFMRTAPLGFNKERVMVLPVRPPMGKLFEPLIEDLKKSEYALHVTRMNDLVGVHHNTHEFNHAGMQEGKWLYFPALVVDETFIPTLGMQLVAGRNFSKEANRDDSLGIIVNESMVKHMKWGSAKQALGQPFHTISGREKVIGVVKDFHFVSLLNPVGPFVLELPHNKLRGFWTRYIAIKIKDAPIDKVVTDIRKIWNKHTQDFPFEYRLLDSELKAQYKAQENLGKLVSIFSLLAIIIACLGLFAMATFSAEQRTKEIGIRKVMGASTLTITLLLSKDFMKLVVLAIVVACPLSWYFLNAWLQEFAYHVETGWFIYVLAGFITIFISLSTVVIRSVRTARLDPVKSLRYE